MTVLERLRAAANDQFEKIYAHPFLWGDGGWNVASCGYKCYMLQDYIYLQQYIML